MKSVCMSSCTAVSTSASTDAELAPRPSASRGQKLMYPASGRFWMPYQLASSCSQNTACAPVDAPQLGVACAVTKTAKSASGMPSPPSVVSQSASYWQSHVLQDRRHRSFSAMKPAKIGAGVGQEWFATH